MSETAPARRGTETRQRRHIAQMRCDDAELAELEARAAAAGLSVGAFMRHRTIGKAGPRSVPQVPVDRAALAVVLAALGHWGGNLNQLARTANTSGDLPAAGDLAELTAVARDMQATLMRALGRGD